MKKDGDISLGDFYAHPVGMYKDFISSSGKKGATQVQPSNVTSTANEWRRPVSAFNTNNSLNFDPWEDMILLEWTPVDFKWSTENCNFCWYEAGAAEYEATFSYCTYTTQGVRLTRLDAVAASYPANWATERETHLVQTIRTTVPPSSMQTETVTWTKPAGNAYTLFSLQNLLDDGYTGKGSHCLQQLRIRQL